MVFVLSAAVKVITPSRLSFGHSAFGVRRVQVFASPSQTKAHERCNVLFGACLDTKLPDYTSTGNTVGCLLAQISHVGPLGQEDLQIALRVSLMVSCLFARYSEYLSGHI